MYSKSQATHEQVGRTLGKELGMQTVRTQEALEISEWAHELANESFMELLDCDTLPEEDALNHVY